MTFLQYGHLLKHVLEMVYPAMKSNFHSPHLLTYNPAAELWQVTDDLPSSEVTVHQKHTLLNF
jgi:hypothetical protein